MSYNITKFVVLILLLSPVLSSVAAAQVEVKLLGNYVSAYRDGSWVPVDVLVTNEGPDIAGSVEIRTIGMTGEPQNPFYRVPANCPKGSRKLFRLYCRFAQCMRIEARLYDAGRLVDKIPATRDISPIAAEDYLSLILDEQVGDYGFLTSVVTRPSLKLRLHRENLKNETLAFLPDYPQCYKPYDVIILGDIDPSLIARRHRVLLKQYVLHGGTLVVCTGAHAEKYRRTWVEDLAGVEIGPEEITTGAALAFAVFSQDDQVGSRASRQGVRAVLTPHADLQTLGNELVLATRRPLGRGSVITLAIDSSSQLLQDCRGYRQMWREVFSCRPKRQDLRFERAGELCGRELYKEAGVKIHSKSAVLAYLGLYFLIGIVANWVVCNHYKRRELAWVFLVLFSLGFTGFAAAFGPGGMSGATQLTQLEVLHVPVGGGLAEAHSFVGIVSHRTSRMSARLVGEFPLAKEVSAFGPGQGPFGRRTRNPGVLAGNDVREPFHLVEDAGVAIDDLKVRARDLRVIGVSGFHAVSGGLEGSLEFDANGLRGFLKNSSGLKIREPFVLFNGMMKKAKPVKGGFEVSLIFGAAADRAAKGPQPWPVTKALPNIGTGFVRALLEDVTPAAGPPNPRNAPKPLDPDLGPFILGWADSPRVGGLRPDRETQETKGATLVVFDVKLQDLTTRSKKPSGLRKDGCGETQWRTGTR